MSNGGTGELAAGVVEVWIGSGSRTGDSDRGGAEDGMIRVRVPVAITSTRQLNMDRPADEAVSRTLDRMSRSLAKAASRGTKSKQWRWTQEEDAAREQLPEGAQKRKLKKERRKHPDTVAAEKNLQEIALLDASGARLGMEGLSVAQAFCPERGEVSLLINGRRYGVNVNRPYVMNVRCPMQPLVGVMLLPMAEAHYCDTEALQWEWWRFPAANNSAADDAGIVVSRARAYTPTPADEGSTLEVRVWPAWQGPQSATGVWSFEEASAVFAAGKFTFRMATHRPPAPPAGLEDGGLGYCRRRAGVLNQQLRTSGAQHADVVRMVSYNCLADGYRCHWNTAFPYCDPALSKPELRLQLCCEEIMVYDADIVCLQEIDTKWFADYWSPRFRVHGYHGLHTPKVAGTEEGCAMFVREGTYEVIAFHEVRVSSLPALEPPSPAAGIAHAHSAKAAAGELLADSDNLAEMWQKLGTVGQLVVLRDLRKPSRVLVVCNTHLYYHGMARHIRMMQAALLLEEAERVRAEFRSRGFDSALVLCGDLNSRPSTGAVSFLLEGCVSSAHPDWLTGSLFRWGFGSSKRSARRMLWLLQSKDATTDVEGLVAAHSEETLAEDAERCKRMATCLAVLSGGVQQATSASEIEDDEEGASELQPDADSLQSGPSSWEVLKTELVNGGTMRTSVVVAAAQLSLDAGLSGAPRLSLDAAAVREAEVACRHLDEEVQRRMEELAAQQAAKAEQLAEISIADGAGVAASCNGFGLELRHQLALASAYKEIPQFTNFVGSVESRFAETLDWIFYDKAHLSAVSSAPLPSRDLVEAETALPSRRFPSDHLLLATDLVWRSDGAASEADPPW